MTKSDKAFVESKIKFFDYFAQLSSSSVPVQSNLNWDLALNLVITTPTQESRDTATSGLRRALKFGMEGLFNQTRSIS